MDNAALSGHLHVVKWLHDNRFEGCTEKAVENAIGNSHLSAVLWLLAHYPQYVNAGKVVWNDIEWVLKVIVMAPSPLTSAGLVLRVHPAIAALPHVAGVVSSFLVPTSSLSLAKACRFGSLKLLDHIWAASCTSIADRKPWWSLTNFLRSDRHYHAWMFSMALREAASQGDLEVVKWLFTHFPGCTAYVGVVEAAAEAGHLHILQFLHANSTAAFSDDTRIDQQHEVPVGLEVGNAITVNWGCDDVVFAAENGYLEIVRW
ncbi:hypothetical protein BBJ28_00024549 [Nothophytophthora sp. Chile5]|nr:hypothetical protein BBJ28_00024549 [Nothophytophthora sp. Chile5]